MSLVAQAILPVRFCRSHAQSTRPGDSCKSAQAGVPGLLKSALNRTSRANCVASNSKLKFSNSDFAFDVSQLSGNPECATLLHSKVRLPRRWNPPQMSLSVTRVWRRFSCDFSVPGK